MTEIMPQDNIHNITAEALLDLKTILKTWNEQEKKKANSKIKEVHYKALDDLVNVNSLFTVAVFVGLSMATRGQQSLENRNECQAGPSIGKMLIVYEVIAFACFLLSSLAAKVIKLHLYLHGTPFVRKSGKPYKFVRKEFDMKDLLLVLAALSSAAGIVFITLSVVNIIQIRIGVLSCGSSESTLAVLCLGIIVGVAFVIYVVSMAVAIHASIRSDHGKETGQL